VIYYVKGDFLRGDFLRGDFLRGDFLRGDCLRKGVFGGLYKESPFTCSLVL